MISTSYSPDSAYVLTRIEDIKALDAENERLRAAKRRALAIADERAKENMALRAALKEIRSLTAKHDLPDAWKIADRALALEQNVSREVER